jgi:hypothetical protein
MGERDPGGRGIDVAIPEGLGVRFGEREPLPISITFDPGRGGYYLGRRVVFPLAQPSKLRRAADRISLWGFHLRSEFGHCAATTR